MAKIAVEKRVVYIVIGAVGASLTNEDCTPYSVDYAIDTTALANGTATAMVEKDGKTWFYLTADYAFGTQLQSAASKVVEAKGGSLDGGAPLQWTPGTSLSESLFLRSSSFRFSGVNRGSV